MKSLITMLILSASLTMAGDYYLLTIGRTNVAADVVTIDVTDKTGDWRDYIRAGLPVPARLPAIVDAHTGDSIALAGPIAQAMRSLRDNQRAAITNEAPGWFGYLTMTTNTMSVIGTNRSGFAVLRYDGTKLTAAQREQYQTECIMYLSARLQLLERELRRKRVVNIRDIVEDVP